MYRTDKPYTAKILELIRTTWDINEDFVVRPAYNRHPAIEPKHAFPLMFHTDGIGTKGYYHWHMRTFKEAALDALAMNFNDIAMLGGIPVAIENHIFLPQDDDGAIHEITSALVEFCRENKVIMTGGETSIQDTIQGLDISITVTAIARPAISAAAWPNWDGCYSVGDTLVGFPSSGLHSNGFTLVRKTLKGYRPDFVVPTRFYHDLLTNHFHSFTCSNHVTGGAFTKLKGNLPPTANAVFRFDSPAIFWDLFRGGVSSEEMYRTFNCGYGLVVGVPVGTEEAVLKVLKPLGGEVIGKVVDGKGHVIVQSSFDGATVAY